MKKLETKKRKVLSLSNKLFVAGWNFCMELATEKQHGNDIASLCEKASKLEGTRKIGFNYALQYIGETKKLHRLENKSLPKKNASHPIKLDHSSRSYQVIVFFVGSDGKEYEDMSYEIHAKYGDALDLASRICKDLYFSTKFKEKEYIGAEVKLVGPKGEIYQSTKIRKKERDIPIKKTRDFEVEETQRFVNSAAKAMKELGIKL